MAAETNVRFFRNGVVSSAGNYGAAPEAAAAHDWAAMLGPTLRLASGEEKPTGEVLASKKKVAFVFAGAWCPWCRAFDPYLTQTYLNLKANDADDTEIVYLSVDVDEEKYGEAVSQKPWVSVPFKRAQGIDEAPIGFIRKKVREEQGKPQGRLAEVFGVASVPTVVVLDGQTGQLVSEKFIDERNGDIAAAGHEWNAKAPTSWLEATPEPTANPWPSLLGETLTAGGEQKPTTDVLANKKHVALLFAGNWCPWCTAFEPFLMQTYRGLTGHLPGDTEIVYLSVDDDEAAFKEKIAGHQLPSVPYNRAQGIDEEPVGFIRKKVREERAAKEGKPELASKQGSLAARFKVTALPTLIVCDGKTAAKLYEDFVTENGEKPAEGHAWTQGKTPNSWVHAAAKYHPGK